VLGVSARREKEIREALQSLPNVAVKFEQPQAVRGQAIDSAAANSETPSGPLHSRLLHLMGSSAHVEAFTNAALEASESILSRTHALRQLADRFPESNEAVHTMAADHHRALRDAIARLQDILHPLTGDIETQRNVGNVDARSLLGAAQRLDTLLTLALASPNQRDDPEEVIARLRRSLAELDAAAAGYKP
jgi:hypothetical protein